MQCECQSHPITEHHTVYPSSCLLHVRQEGAPCAQPLERATASPGLWQMYTVHRRRTDAAVGPIGAALRPVPRACHRCAWPVVTAYTAHRWCTICRSWTNRRAAVHSPHSARPCLTWYTVDAYPVYSLRTML